MVHYQVIVIKMQLSAQTHYICSLNSFFKYSFTRKFLFLEKKSIQVKCVQMFLLFSIFPTNQHKTSYSMCFDAAVQVRRNNTDKQQTQLPDRLKISQTSHCCASL